VFEVLATNGDTHLGGDDWDNRLIDWILAEFKADSGMDLKNQPDAIQRIKEEAEKAKIALSSSQSYDINLPFITADQTGPKHIQKTLTRAKLEQLTDDLFERTVGPVKKCLDDAKVSASHVDELVLVGGMTRMPKVVDTAKKLAGKQPSQGVNPDEVVAIGAAIQGGVLQGDVKDILLLDVTPLTLAIETMGGVATPMIPRNTTIPFKKVETFSTASDNQPGVEVVVTQGERPMSRDNKTLGTFKLEGIEPARRGEPQIEVTFDIDANGILHVAAKDKKTGKSQQISIKGSSGLSQDEIERAKRDAEVHAEEDRKRKEGAEAKNKAEGLVFQVEKQLAELGDKLNDEQKKPITDQLQAIKDAVASNDVDRIKSATDELERLFSQAAAAAQAAGFNPGDAGGGGPAPDVTPGGGEAQSNEPKQAKGKVVDADFEEVDSKK
jgi:molecular chaperone DnaK